MATTTIIVIMVVEVIDMTMMISMIVETSNDNSNISKVKIIIM